MYTAVGTMALFIYVTTYVLHLTVCLRVSVLHFFEKSVVHVYNYNIYNIRRRVWKLYSDLLVFNLSICKHKSMSTYTFRPSHVLFKKTSPSDLNCYCDSWICSSRQWGRVAMLATMGYIVPEYFRFPGWREIERMESFWWIAKVYWKYSKCRGLHVEPVRNVLSFGGSEVCRHPKWLGGY